MSKTIVVTGCILRFGALDSTLEVVEPNAHIELKQGIPIVFENGQAEEPIVGVADLVLTKQGVEAEMRFFTENQRLSFELLKKLKPSVRGQCIQKDAVELIGAARATYATSRINLLSKIMIDGIALSTENTDHGIFSIEGMINDAKK